MTRGSVIASLSPDAQRQVRQQLTDQHVPPLAKETKAPKFRNSAVVVDGYRFPSKRESLRYLALKAEEARGEITDLRIQPAWRIEHNGILICDYVADFSYRAKGMVEPNGNIRYREKVVVEDVKSRATKTRDYIIKRKLMLAFHRIDVVEVS